MSETLHFSPTVGQENGNLRKSRSMRDAVLSVLAGAGLVLSLGMAMHITSETNAGKESNQRRVTIAGDAFRFTDDQGNVHMAESDGDKPVSATIFDAPSSVDTTMQGW